MSSNLCRSNTSLVRRYDVLDAALGERDILGGHDTTATTQHDTKRGVGLVLLFPLPSLHAQVPADGSSALRHRYLGKSLVYTGKYGRDEEVTSRSRGEMDRITDCG